MHAALYQIAFLKHDLPGMAQQVAWAEGKPGKENVMLYLEAGTAAYSGKLEAAREFSRQAPTSAMRPVKRKWRRVRAAAALWRTLYGNGAGTSANVLYPATESYATSNSLPRWHSP